MMATKKRSARADRAVAFHEAGHAVIAWRLRVGIGRDGATIVPGEEFAGWVHVENNIDGDPSREIPPRMVAAMEKRIMVSMAGEEAQRRYDPRFVRSFHASSDRDSIAALLLRLCSSDAEEFKLYEGLLRHRTRRAVAMPLTWRMIECVANGLLEHKTLKRSEVGFYCRHASQSLLDERWRQTR